ncbi:hypothetical protein [Mesorhizobium sp. YR577]|uniref:hypothetical protein n=1 Tax=Mesorhizobium sp. YR577 TaxID=1884373 RepID=UPI000B8A2615|nr:hypothetical protein [Mesorhizobium sp. YR577]
MPQLHARGVELVVEILDAADHFEKMPASDIKKLLRETSLVLGDLLARYIPSTRKDAAARDHVR